MPVLWTYIYNVLWFLWELSFFYIIYPNWSQGLSFSLMSSLFSPDTKQKEYNSYLYLRCQAITLISLKFSFHAY